MAKDEKKAVAKEGLSLPFGRRNYLLMGAGLAAIIIGYIALGSGSITLAPILLVLGYCVLFPLGIVLGDRREKPVGGGE